MKKTKPQKTKLKQTNKQQQQYNQQTKTMTWLIALE